MMIFHPRCYAFPPGHIGLGTWGYKPICSGGLPFRHPMVLQTSKELSNKFRHEVYITYRGGQPEKLRFVLDGEDHCIHRQTFLDGQTLTWLGKEIR